MTLIAQPSGALQKSLFLSNERAAHVQFSFCNWSLTYFRGKPKNSSFHKALSCIFGSIHYQGKEHSMHFPQKKTPVSMCHTQAILAGTRNIFLQMRQEKSLLSSSSWYVIIEVCNKVRSYSEPVAAVVRVGCVFSEKVFSKAFCISKLRLVAGKLISLKNDKKSSMS